MQGEAKRGAALARAALRVRERVIRGDPDPGRGRTAILIVNGFDRRASSDFDVEEARRFPWIRLCLEQLERHAAASPYDVFVWDNSFLPEHREILEASPRVSVFSKPETDVRHGRALDLLLREVPDEIEHVVTLDTDAFPIRDGWLDNLLGRLDERTWIAGVWRDELAPRVRAYVHPSCLVARRETLLELDVRFARKGGVHRVDVGQRITEAVVSAGGRISRLRRSNARNMHFLMAGLYGDLVYHHGAGSRQAYFWTTFDAEADEAVRVALRDAAFNDLDGLIGFLAGNGPREEPEDPGLEPGSGLRRASGSPGRTPPDS